MFIITIIIVASGLIVALALAASASRSAGSVLGDVLQEDEHIRPINMAPKPFTTSHQGIATDARSVISAAGLQ
jgi:hypothetical protein